MALVCRTFTGGSDDDDDVGDVTMTSSVSRLTGFRGCSAVDWMRRLAIEQLSFIRTSHPPFPPPTATGTGRPSDDDVCSRRVASPARYYHTTSVTLVFPW